MKIQISKKLTPIVLFLSVFSLIVFSNASVQGHSPNSATLEYDEINSKLNVTFSHSVSDPNSHYIESVVIKVNGTEVETMDYTSQPTTNTFTYQYDINAGPGAEIEVTGYCNQAGSVSNTLTVPGGVSNGTENGDESNGIPGYELFALISILVLVPIVYNTKKKSQA